MTETFVCSCCGQEYPICDCYEVGNRTFCPDCPDEETLVCTHCEERILNHQNAGDEDSTLCQHCFDNHYLNCDRCGSLLRRDDANYLTSDSEEPFCYDCYSSECRESAIHDYNYKPEPLFYGDGDRYFGIELEIDGGGERSAPAEEILSIANKDHELIYCKHDGSLDSGFEIVTHPMTLGFHCNSMPWQTLLQKARSLGYTSHQANTCGLHLHVSRSALGLDVYQQDAVIARILYFFEKNWDELLKFSRRTAYQLNRWAARYGYKEQPKEILDHVKKNYVGRYTCVNLVNEETVEFRSSEEPSNTIPSLPHCRWLTASVMWLLFYPMMSSKHSLGQALFHTLSRGMPGTDCLLKRAKALYQRTCYSRGGSLTCAVYLD